MFDYAKSISARQTQVCTPSAFDKIVDDPAILSTLSSLTKLYGRLQAKEIGNDEYEKEKSRLKKHLPVFMFHAHFSDGHRSNKSAVASGLSIFDLDHIDSPLEAWRNICPQLTQLGIVLAHVTPSGHGLRVVFRMPENMSLQQAQVWFAQKAGIKDFDTSVKDLARCSFAVSRSYILYRGQDLFADPVKRLRIPSDEREQALSVADSHAAEPTTKEEDSADSHASDTAADDTPASDKDVELFDNFAVSVGHISLDKLNDVGTRHNNLMLLLSRGLWRFMPKERLMAVVRQRMPEFCQEEDCRGLLDDWYTKYADDHRPMSKALQQFYVKMSADESADTSDDEQTAEYDFDFSKLPQPVADTLAELDRQMRMPALCALLPLLGTYADNASSYYLDKVVHHPGLMSVVVGPQASGKSACAKVVQTWLKPLLSADSEERKKEEEYKRKKRDRKLNEAAPEDPKPLIRFVPLTISCTTLLRRFKLSQGHTLFSFGEELDTMTKSNGAGSWSEKYDVYRLAFDRGLWGQDYNGETSISGVVKVAYNLSILGTYNAFQRCFNEDNIENGLSSRFLIGEMPDMFFSKSFPHFTPSKQLKEEIKSAIDKLTAYRGNIDMKLTKAALSLWLEDIRRECVDEVNLTKDLYRKRAAVIGFRSAMIMAVLFGQDNEACASFARFMAQYSLDMQLKFFGETMAKVLQTMPTQNLKPTALFSRLPETFSVDDVMTLKKGTSKSYCYVIVSRWHKLGMVEKNANRTWTKTKHK